MNVDRALLLGVIFLSVFLQAYVEGIRQLTGAQPDMLPPLMVYAALSGTLGSVVTVAVAGGFLLDSLSVNPAGVSVLPLLATGIVLHANRDLIMRNELFARCVLGAAASAIVPAATLILLLTMGHSPNLGLGTLWQLLFLTASGSVLTPLAFILFARLRRAFAYGRAATISHRYDREIRRGR